MVLSGKAGVARVVEAPLRGKVTGVVRGAAFVDHQRSAVPARAELGSGVAW